MTLARRQFVQGLALATSAPAVFAQTAPITLKWANNIPVTHPSNVRIREAVEAIKKDTNGKVDIQVFPNNQLGGDTDMLSQVRSGAIDIFPLSGLILQTLVPVAGINGLELGAHVRAAVGKVNLHVFDRCLDNGYRNITSSTRPINTAADLKGFKIRVPVSPLWTSMFKALEASPASINFSEVYSALQTKVVEGQENPLAIIATARLYEVQKYCSMTNHVWDAYWILGNRKAVERLPKDIQEIVFREFDKSANDERADIAVLSKSLRGDLQAKGLQFIEPDKKAFKAALAKTTFYKDWRGKFGEDAWKLLEESAGSLA